MPLEPPVDVKPLLGPLRFLGQLTGTQMSLAYRSQGLPISQMTGVQRAALGAALHGKDGQTASAFRIERGSSSRGATLRGMLRDVGGWRDIWRFYLDKKSVALEPPPRSEGAAATSP